ncbi:MAG: ATP synthase subunit I [Oxalobacter sp.]|nr:MAG: ATP synthase subunit I [Oxalobacter sp.]
MARIIRLQLLATIVVALLAVILAGGVAGVSVLLGGLSCMLPNALFAMRLFMNERKPGGASPTTFFIWEFVKIGLTMSAMVAVGWLYEDIVWPAFIVGVIVALKSYIILLFRNQP